MQEEKKLVEWDKFVRATNNTKTLIAKNKSKITEIETRMGKGTLAVGTATSLSNLDPTKGIIVVTISASSSISLSSAMEIGQTLTIVINNTSASDITQAVPVTNGWTCIQGDSMTITASKISELSILCYAENKYSVSFVSAQ